MNALLLVSHSKCNLYSTNEKLRQGTTSELCHTLPVVNKVN